MTREDFLNKVLEIADEKPDYKLGGDGSKGVCDCVGLIIGAMRRCGVIYDETHTHGSNHIARHDSDNLRKIERADQLQVGDCVFKAYNPGDSRWDLPEYYKGHPDQRDYYHVGVVTGTAPMQITHMTSPTIKVDTVLGRWEYAARMKQLKAPESSAASGGSSETERGESQGAGGNYASSPDSKEEVLMEAYKANVVLKRPELPNNGLVVRPEPSTNADEIDKLKHGAIVTVQAIVEDFAYVTYDGGSGYVNMKYLQRIPEDAKEIPVSEEAVVQLVITDSDGNVFRPVGECTMDVEIIVKG